MSESRLRQVPPTVLDIMGQAVVRPHKVTRALMDEEARRLGGVLVYEADSPNIHGRPIGFRPFPGLAELDDAIRLLDPASRETFVASLGTTCDWPMGPEAGGSRCGLSAPFAGADGPVDIECWERLCAYHATISAAGDLRGDDRARALRELVEQWASIDKARA